MGSIRGYKCNKCGYSVQTSGGKDYGFLASTETFICHGCNNIVDVVVGQRGEIFPKELVELMNQVEFKKLVELVHIDSSLLDQLYKCPECDSKNQLEVWSVKKRTCPRCDGKMNIDRTVGLILWD